MHLDEVKEMIQDDKSLLQSFVEKDAKVVQLEEMLLQKDVIIKSLKEELFSKTTRLKAPNVCRRRENQNVIQYSFEKKSGTFQSNRVCRSITMNEKNLNFFLKEDIIEKVFLSSSMY